MDPKVALVHLMLWSLFLSFIVGGGGRKLSQIDEQQLEKQFKLLNKPAVTTIQTINGDTYNCVDFYKQPAFDHPLLKNHTFKYKMPPPSFRKGIRNNGKAERNVWLIGEGCPKGTVPIRKITKEGLVRANLAAEMYSSRINPQVDGNPSVHVALVRTSDPDPGRRYKGAGAMISVYNITNVTDNQYTSARIMIKNGDDYIAVGWTVNPSLYKDTLTRPFIYTNTKTSHCFNTFCPGFVHVRSDVPLDLVYDEVSQRGVKTLVQDYLIYRDETFGNWHLLLGTAEIGFWPKAIFTDLANPASYIEWGGEVMSPTDKPSPPMGSGFLPVRDTLLDGFCGNITVVNEMFQLVDANYRQEYKDIRDTFYSLDDKGFYVFFGGKGGYKPN